MCVPGSSLPCASSTSLTAIVIDCLCRTCTCDGASVRHASSGTRAVTVASGGPQALRSAHRNNEAFDDAIDEERVGCDVRRCGHRDREIRVATNISIREVVE